MPLIQTPRESDGAPLAPNDRLRRLEGSWLSFWMSPVELAALASLGEVIEVGPGQDLFAGDEGHLYVILDGAVAPVTDGAPAFWLGPGDILGEGASCSGCSGHSEWRRWWPRRSCCACLARSSREAPGARGRRSSCGCWSTATAPTPPWSASPSGCAGRMSSTPQRPCGASCSCCRTASVPGRCRPRRR